MPRLGIGAALKNAFTVLLKNFGTIFFIAVLAGGIGDGFSFVAGQALGDALIVTLEVGGGNSAQVEAVISSLCVTLFQVLWYGPVGAWAAASTIYLWVQHEKQKPASLYDAANFGLNRLGRVLGPHWLSYLFIQLGGIIIVGAILLGLKYAFVDAIATLDDKEKDPLARSGRLTLGRRGTIFRVFLVFSPWIVGYGLALTFLLPEAGVGVQAASGVVSQMVLCAIDLVMVQLYLDLFRKREERPQAQALSVGGAAPPPAGSAT